jgi:hypothetical protein
MSWIRYPHRTPTHQKEPNHGTKWHQKRHQIWRLNSADLRSDVRRVSLSYDPASRDKTRSCRGVSIRLTASEFPSPSPAIVCCKSLYKSKLENTASTVPCYRYYLIAIDFERPWATKMGTVNSVALDRFYKTLPIENASHIPRSWNEANPERPASAV